MDEDERFQFLMVRLKGSGPPGAVPPDCVSIPYGTIKSSVTQLMNYYKIQFQFLMVRLKVTMHVTCIKTFPLVSIPYGTIKSMRKGFSYRDIMQFQFLMVRLKVIQDSRIASKFRVSIPYGTIKSYTRP